MKQVEVTIKGTSALLMHRFPLAPIKAIDKKSPEEQAEIAAYRHPQTDELYIPGVNFQRALVKAAVYSKGKGRASLQKVAAAGLFVSPEYLLLGTREYVVDTRPVVMPATKGRVLRHRPRLDQWKASATIDYDEELLAGEQVRQIVDDAGTRIGLLDFRPECKGPFGRFVVVRWDTK